LQGRDTLVLEMTEPAVPRGFLPLTGGRGANGALPEYVKK
jgi:hypothetical protein